MASSRVNTQRNENSDASLKRLFARRHAINNASHLGQQSAERKKSDP
jgi:hypothetical protein